MLLLLSATAVGRPDDRKLVVGGHVTGTGSGGGRGRCAADDVGVVSRVHHVNRQFWKRPERLAALHSK